MSRHKWVQAVSPGLVSHNNFCGSPIHVFVEYGSHGWRVRIFSPAEEIVQFGKVVLCFLYGAYLQG